MQDLKAAYYLLQFNINIYFVKYKYLFVKIDFIRIVIVYSQLFFSAQNAN